MVVMSTQKISDVIANNQRGKKELLVFLLIVLVIVAAIYFGLKRTQKEGAIIETPVKKLVKAIYLKEVKLDTAFLKTEKFKALRSFGELPIKIGERGRMNPFSAY